MIISFNEHFKLPIAEVYSYFESPADWTRLYGLAGDSKDLGGGWFAIALKTLSVPARGKEHRTGNERSCPVGLSGFLARPGRSTV